MFLQAHFDWFNSILRNLDNHFLLVFNIIESNVIWTIWHFNFRANIIESNIKFNQCIWYSIQSKLTLAISVKLRACLCLRSSCTDFSPSSILLAIQVLVLAGVVDSCFFPSMFGSSSRLQSLFQILEICVHNLSYNFWISSGICFSEFPCFRSLAWFLIFLVFTRFQSIPSIHVHGYPCGLLNLSVT